MSAELIEEAKQEWKDRGYDPMLFELDKMLEIWKKEEEDDQAERAGKVMRGELILLLSQKLPVPTAKQNTTKTPPWLILKLDDMQKHSLLRIIRTRNESIENTLP